MKNGYYRNIIPDCVIEEKAKKLNVKILEKFSKNKHTYLKIKCLTHLDKPEREVELYNFLNRSKTCGCLLCEYTKEDLLKNPKVRPDIEVLGDYINNSTPILCKCKICGNEWSVTPNKLTQGRGCPLCASTKISSGERYIAKILKDNHVNFEAQKSFCGCKNPKTNRALKFDFYLPYYNTCIEFNGKQHYEPVVFRYNSKNKNKEELRKEATKNSKKYKKEIILKKFFAREIILI